MEEKLITYFKYDTLDSTNREAQRLAARGFEGDFAVISTLTQTAGRGRGGRTWLNTEGALLMTILHRCDDMMGRLPLLGFAAALAVKNAVGQLTDDNLILSVKWPNDVVSKDKGEKLCGILSESFSIDNGIFAAIGIGVNVNAEVMPEGLMQPASSVYLKSGIRITPKHLRNAIALEYVKLTELLASDPEAFMELYRKNCSTLGRRIAIRRGAAGDDGDRIPADALGRALDISNDGGLVAELADGSTETLYAADVSVRSAEIVDEPLARAIMPARDPKGNKGKNGRAAMIVGFPGMAGAAVMSSAAAIRAGAGLTKVLIPKEIFPAFAALPEAMLVTDDGKADELISWATAVGIGCGMGVNDRTAELVKKVLLSGKPCVIDADGLNTLSQHPELVALLHPNCVLTPHPGEMARLCGTSVEAVLADFTATAQSFAKTHNCTVLLKSAESVIASPDGRIRYNTSGNSGLAKGGSGDVLCGIVTSMLAQGANPFDAASLGSYLLGTSAENALSLLAERFITATDVTDAITQTLSNIKA